MFRNALSSKGAASFFSRGLPSATTPFVWRPRFAGGVVPVNSLYAIATGRYRLARSHQENNYHASDGTLAYVCIGTHCSEPATTPQALQHLIERPV